MLNKKIFTKKRYKIVGKHSAVKICSWTRNSLVNKGVCYKEKFYNIKSHRCLQMTPAVAWCSHSCLFCWRPLAFTEGNSMEKIDLDDPKFIVEESIKAQKDLLMGFKGNPKCKKEMFEQAINPNQVAISLAGEPTLYPKLNGLIKEYHKKDFTSFLVSNGMNPTVLKNLDPLPTQLYITLVANNKKDYLKITRSRYGEDGFERLMESIKIFSKLKTRKVLRLTLVKNYNFKNPKEYAEIIKKSNTHFVEAKSYMHVGDSQNRLERNNMPSFKELMKFSKELAKELGWKVIDYHERSRAILIAKEDYKWRKL